VYIKSDPAKKTAWRNFIVFIIFESKKRQFKGSNKAIAKHSGYKSLLELMLHLMIYYCIALISQTIQYDIYQDWKKL
jgi:hypothetical protein